ncbi:MAG: DUF448 domain-containing protein [Desulfovibrio sp.]|nr:DUF448 domain-containing protein [Desulfovibrio sp.]
MGARLDHAPVRMCVICGRRAAKKELSRFVLPARDGAPAADEKQTAPGRGFYVCAQGRCREAFARSGWKRKAKGRRS